MQRSQVLNCVSDRIIFAMIIVSLCSDIVCWEQNYDKDTFLSLNDLVRQFGLDGMESYTFTTADGYIIELERIKRPGREQMVPILFTHGLTACADSFFIMKNRSLPVDLAHHKYDIWMLNNRGTLKSLQHTKWNSSTDREFWYFSWQEIGLIDLPGAIDIVLANNRHQKIVLIGHSEGTTTVFVLLSERPEYNEKVLLSIHLGVSVYHEECGTVPIFQAFCKYPRELQEFLDRMGIFTVSLPGIRQFMVQMCSYDIFRDACNEVMKYLTQSVDQISEVKDWTFIISRSTCGGSTRELLHYMQVGNTGRFAKFDFGPEENRRIYGSREPPLFPLENVNSPVALWCGRDDIFCTQHDLNKLYPKLSNIVSSNFEGKNKTSHINFVIGKYTEKQVFSDIKKLLKKFTSVKADVDKN